MQRLYYKFVVMKLLGMSKYCITTTRFNQNRLIHWLPKSRPALIYSFDDTLQPIKSRSKATGEKSHILLVLTNSPNKRWKDLIKQAFLLSRQSPERYIFHLVSPQKEFFEKVVGRTQKILNIRFYKNLDQKCMYNLYRSVDYYWTASIVEGFGIPVRMATLAGVQVIAPDTPINRESSCNLGHYYMVEDGDKHAYITIKLESNRNPGQQTKNYELARKEINEINIDFIQTYLNNHLASQKQKMT